MELTSPHPNSSCEPPRGTLKHRLFICQTQKTFLIALKLAQFDILKKESGVSPILLLDDIFDKLDEHRVAQIINLVNHDDFGQLFISDTHASRTENIIKEIHQSYEIFNL